MPQFGGIVVSNRTALARVYVIHREIDAGNYPNVPALSEQLEVSERTVRRDLELMRDQLGAPLEYDRERRGYTYRRPFELPPLELTEEEIEAIWIAHQWLRQVRGTPYEQAMQRAWNKIALSFGLNASLMDSWPIATGADTTRGSGFSSIDTTFRKLEQAAQENCVVRIEYHSLSTDRVTAREIEPILLYLSSEGCYCIAFCRLRSDYRTFHVGRIRKLTVTGERFEPHCGFRHEDYFAGSLGVMRGDLREISIRFTHEQARYLDEHPCHHSQRRHSEDAEGVTYAFTLADNLETLRWILSFGAAATVLEPRDLRLQVIAEIEKSLMKYE
jgi:predicted DNA-binding transcriptional regulator YafY